MADILKELYNEMVDIYRKADKECGYRPSRYLEKLVRDNDPVKTAIDLVTKDGGTDGFAK